MEYRLLLFLEIAIYYYLIVSILSYKRPSIKATKHYQPENLGEEDLNLNWELDIIYSSIDKDRGATIWGSIAQGNYTFSRNLLA